MAENAQPLAQVITPLDGDESAKDFIEVPLTRDYSDEWQQALEQVVPACVVLKVTQTRAFDTEVASSSYATGFVVDAQRGLILTNRHVVTPGPVTAEAIFHNREEVSIRPLYYDPVHDFGFFRFNPKDLQFMKVVDVALAPEVASVGLEVRVVGNDSGEKISILAGTIARVDRDAPKYGKGYNDFNTFYLQAASGTKGGSSGSPVIDGKGRVVALNAGGKTKAASAFYLPLERVVRALSLLKECYDPVKGLWRRPHIPRGDLQATFVFKGFDDVRRLGLSHDTEAAVRASCAETKDGLSTAGGVGMLVVESVVPGSMSDGVLEPGDVLVRINGEIVTHFLPLEDILDRHVGKEVVLKLERNGVLLTLPLKVQDLDAVTPKSFLEFAGSCVHSLSYQQARNNRLEVGQVYVANEGGYMLSRAGVPEHAIITSLANQPTSNLEAFAWVLRRQVRGAQVPVQYYTFSDRHRRRNGIVYVDDTWYGPTLYWTRDDAAGAWNSTENWPCPDDPPACSPVGATPSGRSEGTAEPALPPSSSADAIAPAGGSTAEVVTGSSPETGDDLGQAYDDLMQRCMVQLEVDIPLVALADGVHSRCFTGTGVIVEHNEDGMGLIVTDRNTVSINAGDVLVSFGAYPAEAYGKIVFLHPLYNYSILSYSAKDLPLEARRLITPADIASDYIVGGEKVQLVGLTKQMRIMRRSATVTHPCSSTSLSAASVPRFRAVHEEVVKLDHDFGNTFSGVLANRQGQVRAIWASYSEQVNREEREWCAGLPSALFKPWVTRIKSVLLDPNGVRHFVPMVPTLDAELEPIMMHKAQKWGLPVDWVAQRTRLDPQRRQVLRVRSRLAGSDAAKKLKDGDMLLAINSTPVWGYRDVEAFVENLTPGPYRMGGKRTFSIAFPSSSEENSATASETAVMETKALSLELTLFRDHQLMKEVIHLGEETGWGTERMVHWCGAQLQAPHRAVRELGFLPPGQNGVFVSRWHHGSPSHRYGLYALHWILEVNGQPTPDLDTFVEIVKTLEDRSFVRVKLCQLETTKYKILALKQDLHYWPTYEVRFDRDTCTWARQVLRSGDAR